MEVKFPLLLIYSMSIYNTFSCHSLVLFSFLPYNKVLLDFYFAHVFFFLFFLFHDLDLELGLSLFSSWLGNLVNLIVFISIMQAKRTCCNNFAKISNIYLISKRRVGRWGPIIKHHKDQF